MVNKHWIGRLPEELPQPCPICGTVQTAHWNYSWIECIQCGENLHGLWYEYTAAESASDKLFNLFGLIIVHRTNGGITFRI